MFFLRFKLRAQPVKVLIVYSLLEVSIDIGTAVNEMS